MHQRALQSLLAVVLIASTAVVPVACGNAWITASDRDTTLAALMSKAEYAYDKSRFDEAAKYFERALAKDPTYQDARIKLAYALNGSAGLSILDFITRFLVTDNDTQNTGTGPGPLALLKATVGMDETTADGLKNSEYRGVEALRTASERLRKLQKSWETVCPLLPRTVIDSVFQTESADLKRLFPIENCAALPEGQTVKSAALFAAALQFMAQATDLFVIMLDTDGNNEIDLAEKGVAAVNELTRLQSEASSTTGPKKFGDSLKAINTQLDLLQTLQTEINGEVVNYTLACFTFITVLFAQIPNLPKEIVANIEKVVTQINEGRSRLAEYLTYDASSPNSTQGTKAKEAAKQAQQTIDELYKKAKTPDQKAELDAEIDQVCANFDATKKQFGLPDDVARPANCKNSGFLALASPQEFVASSSRRDTDAQQPEVASQSYLWRRIPLPSELNPKLAPTDTSLQESRGDSDPGFDAVTEFLRFGEELRRR